MSGHSTDLHIRSATRRVTALLCRRRSAILCYHGVAESNSVVDPHFLRVSPSAFRSQIELLRDAGFEFVTVAELAQRAGGSTPPPGLVALSFDDGMDDNHHVALPILREYGVPATIYVATGLIGKPNPWIAADSGARMMTEEELVEVAASGVELGAHTVSHPDLSRMGMRDSLREMVGSRDALNTLSGVKVRTFAYPFCKYGPEALAAAREAGFEAAVTCHGRGSWAPLELKRSMITGKDTLPSFVMKLGEIYEPLFDSAPGRLVRVGTRSARRRLRTARERA